MINTLIHWVSTGISEAKIKNASPDITFSLNYIGNFQFGKVKFKGICLKQDSESFLHKNKLIYIFHMNWIHCQNIHGQKIKT